MICLNSIPESIFWAPSSHLPSICQAFPWTLLLGPQSSLGWSELACLWPSPDVPPPTLPGTLASGQQLQLLISALILSSMRVQPPAYAKTTLSPLPLCPILSVCLIPSYFSNNISQTLCHLVKVKLSLSQTGECAVTPVHCLLQCTLIKLFLRGY